MNRIEADKILHEIKYQIGILTEIDLQDPTFKTRQDLVRILGSQLLDQFPKESE